MEFNAEQVKKALECCQKRKCQSCTYDVFGNPLSNCKVKKHALALINSQEQKIEELTAKNERLGCVIGILERDVAERDEMLERKVEEVYPEFMRDYKLMREELTELQKEVELDECQGT